MRRSLNKTEKGLVLGFASNLLSERTHNHVCNFIELESGLSQKYFMPTLLEVAGKFGEGTIAVLNDGYEVDEVILSDGENEVHAAVPSLLSCDDDNFFLLFRMKKSSLQALEAVFMSLPGGPEVASLLPSVPLEQKLLMTTWILGTQEVYKVAAQMFNVSVEDCERSFIGICSVLAENISKYVSWPSAEEAELIANAIDGQFGFPGVVGIIGSASIKFSYSNQISREGSCVLQVVCDHNTVIHDVTLGPSGMDSVSGVFETSSIYKKLTSKKKPLITPFKHVIGSIQYQQLASLLTPYRGEVLTEDEKQYNAMHESVRKCVDKCFNTLVIRFNRLQSVICSQADHVNLIVLATCFLHNFLIQEGDEIECM